MFDRSLLPRGRFWRKFTFRCSWYDPGEAGTQPLLVSGQTDNWQCQRQLSVVASCSEHQLNSLDRCAYFGFGAGAPISQLAC